MARSPTRFGYFLTGLRARLEPGSRPPEGREDSLGSLREVVDQRARRAILQAVLRVIRRRRSPQPIYPFSRPAIILSAFPCGCQGWRTHPGWPVTVRLTDSPGPGCRSTCYGARWPICTASWSRGLLRAAVLSAAPEWHIPQNVLARQTHVGQQAPVQFQQVSAIQQEPLRTAASVPLRRKP